MDFACPIHKKTNRRRKYKEGRKRQIPPKRQLAIKMNQFPPQKPHAERGCCRRRDFNRSGKIMKRRTKKKKKGETEQEGSRGEKNKAKPSGTGRKKSNTWGELVLQMMTVI